jgi:hypothetical protein
VNQPLAVLPHAGKIPALFDAHRAAKLQPGGLGGHGPSNRREALAALAPAIAQGGAPAFGAFASQKTMLPDPATFGRLILSFHKFNSIKWREYRATNEFGKYPKIGTREHISELLGVKDAKRPNLRFAIYDLSGGNGSALKDFVGNDLLGDVRTAPGKF